MSMASYDAPKLWTNEPATCPDCMRGSQPDPQPPEAFYWYRVAARGGAWRRSAYCKVHQRARDKAWRKARTTADENE